MRDNDFPVTLLDSWNKSVASVDSKPAIVCLRKLKFETG